MWDLVGNPEDRFSHNKAHLVEDKQAPGAGTVRTKIMLSGIMKPDCVQTPGNWNNNSITFAFVCFFLNKIWLNQSRGLPGQVVKTTLLSARNWSIISLLCVQAWLWCGVVFFSGISWFNPIWCQTWLKMCEIILTSWKSHLSYFLSTGFVHHHARQSIEPRHEKTCFGGFWPGQTQTGLYNHRRWLQPWNFRFRK